MYKYDLHALTSDFTYSGRSSISAEETVVAHIEAGYSGIVLTNPWGNKVFSDEQHAGKSMRTLGEEFISAYEKLRSVAGNDLVVLLGAEMSVPSASGEFLIYGLTPKFILEYDRTISDAMWFTDFITNLHSSGDILVYQAVPFANGSVIIDLNGKDKHPLRTIDGLEVYNHCKADVCSNPFAQARAEYYGVGGISGSDLSHSGENVGGGIITKSPILSNDDLLTVLKSRDYSICKGEEV
ncbi:MAG: hypothetical protein IKT70_00870 [Clostridia bacterium]|nr:hypothetical protein [Clostridia bacterium]